MDDLKNILLKSRIESLICNTLSNLVPYLAILYPYSSGKQSSALKFLVYLHIYGIWNFVQKLPEAILKCKNCTHHRTSTYRRRNEASKMWMLDPLEGGPEQLPILQQAEDRPRRILHTLSVWESPGPSPNSQVSSLWKRKESVEFNKHW